MRLRLLWSAPTHLQRIYCHCTLSLCDGINQPVRDTVAGEEEEVPQWVPMEVQGTSSWSKHLCAADKAELWLCPRRCASSSSYVHWLLMQVLWKSGPHSPSGDMGPSSSSLLIRRGSCDMCCQIFLCIIVCHAINLDAATNGIDFWVLWSSWLW